MLMKTMGVKEGAVKKVRRVKKTGSNSTEEITLYLYSSLKVEWNLSDAERKEKASYATRKQPVQMCGDLKGPIQEMVSGSA